MKTFTSARWFKNGDHPNDYDNEKIGFENGELRRWTGGEAKALGWEGQVVRYFRNPDCDGWHVCPQCGQTTHHHGWIDDGGSGQTVCPGDYVLTYENGSRAVCNPMLFAFIGDTTADIPA